jgi:hypothetical protein
MIRADQATQRVAQIEPTPRHAVCGSEGHGVGQCDSNCNEPVGAGNDDKWEPSELDDVRWGLAPLLDLGEISSEERPGKAGGALRALAGDVAAQRRPGHRLPRFATLAPWDAGGPDDEESGGGEMRRPSSPVGDNGDCNPSKPAKVRERANVPGQIAQTPATVADSAAADRGVSTFVPSATVAELPSGRVAATSDPGAIFTEGQFTERSVNLNASRQPEYYVPGPSEIAEACAAFQSSWTYSDAVRRGRDSHRTRHLPWGVKRRDFRTSPMILGLPAPAQEKAVPTHGPTLNWGWERTYRRSRRNPRWLGLGLLRRWAEEVTKRDEETEAA